MTTYDSVALWSNCLKDIELEVSRANFNTWFKHTSINREESGTVYVGVPNEFVKDWLYNKYDKLILKILMHYSEHVRGIEYIITKHDMKKGESTLLHTKLFANKELPIADLYINKDDNLNPRYIFESFVVGPFNELAHAAVQAVSTRPGVAYNPLFIYGNTGLGKTHLIQALGNIVKKKYPDKKVYYTTLEKFSIDYVTSLQNNKPNVFKEKYRKYDVLIMDDIQFINKMEKTQEELFHLFNTLYENNKQIVFSSDKHPNYIPGLEDRLKSRFSQGMIVDIREPDYESRVAILRAKMTDVPFSISDDVLDYVATSIQGNIRELEGSLNSIVCQAELKQRGLSIQEVRALLKNSIKPKKNVSAEEVVAAVSSFYNIEKESVYEKTRRKEIVKARQIIMYILREEFNVSYPLIGQKLGGKDHTTVIHSYEKIKNDIKKDQNLAQELDQLRVMFK